jgi:hypothetical protein
VTAAVAAAAAAVAASWALFSFSKTSYSSSSSPGEEIHKLLKGLSHEMNLAFDDMYG